MGGDSSCYAEYRMSQPFDENHVVETHSVLPSLKAGYSWFTDENIQRSLPAVSILFYTSFYAWLAFICTVALTARKQYRYLVLSMILFGYIISLIPGPCMIVRYMLGIILCMPVMTGITFYRGKWFGRPWNVTETVYGRGIPDIIWQTASPVIHLIK